MLVALTIAAIVVIDDAHAHQGAWESHSTKQAGGPPRADSMRECERLDNRVNGFAKHRCKHKIHWDLAYRHLSAGAKRWLAITGGCETHGYPRYFASYRVDTGNGFLGRYQFSPSTAWSAGFRDPGGHLLPPHRVYYREQDVRTWRWRLRTSASQWPYCAAW